MSDAEILKLVAAGQTDLYAEIFRRHRERAFGLAFQYLRDREEAKDIVQDAFIRAYRNISQFKLDRDFGAWFLTIVRNLSIDFLRKRKRLSADGLPPTLSDPKAKDSADKNVLRGEVWKALQRLKVDQREIVFLKDYLGHSYLEIAEILEIPLGTVMSRLHHARKNLFAALQEDRNHEVPRN